MKYIVTLNGKDYEVEVFEGQAAVLNVSDSKAPTAPAVSAAPVVSAPAPAAQAAPQTLKEGAPLNCPMPGTIAEVKTSAGTAVKKGDVLFILEAMKMENEITAPADGTVASVNVSKGTQVESGTLLAVIK